MKKLFLILLCVSVLFSGCGSIDVDLEKLPSRQDRPAATKATETTQPVETTHPTETTLPTTAGDQANQLLMLYMVGSNLESEAGLASYDIEEILASDFDEENMSVLICAGGASFWWTSEISNEECGVYEVGNGDLTQVHTLHNDNMAAPETLTEFLDYGYSAYDADYYNLILWNHGGGAVLGFGLDENHEGDTLSLHEMDTAFQNTRLISDGKRFEWVGFDACLMGMAEVANMLSDYANYLIASEETEAGTGWDYTCLDILSDGSHCDGLSASEEIIRAYQNFQETKFRYTPDYTLSSMDLSKVDSMITALDALVLAAQDDLMQGNYSKIAKLRDQTKTFGKITSEGLYDTVDLYDLCKKLMSRYPDEAAALQAAVEDVVVCQTTNVHGAHGVAVYFPYENKDYASGWLDVYETLDFSPAYTSFIRSFTDTLSGKQLAQWDIKEVAPIESDTTPGEYYVQLTNEQTENFSRGKYSIWEAESNRPGCYICWINSYDVHLSEDGVLSSGFKGKRFFLGDSAGNSLACTAFEIERNAQYVKYCIPMMIFYDNGGILPAVKAGYLHYRVDQEYPEGRILGIYQQYEADSTLFPNRDLVEIETGMSIAPFLFSREIVFREDGSVAPFEEWKVSSGTGDFLDFQGDLTVTIQDTESGVEYCCLFNVTDTQGNNYLTNPIYIQY